MVGARRDFERHVLYDPCEQITRMIPVGSSRVEVIDKVLCTLP
jgi:hypothetical protein